jgi:hypothetical protein
MIPFILFLIFIPRIESQIISISLCSDLACSKDCEIWTATLGKCTSYKRGSSIVSDNSISLYTDSQCQKPILGQQDMTLFMDVGCKTLYAYNDNKIGSYKASNTLVIVVSVIGGTLFLICFSIFCQYYYKKYRQVKPAPNATAIEMPVIVVKPNITMNPYFLNK